MPQALTGILLLDLPVYPKGTLALSLYAVAAAWDRHARVAIIDLNHETLEAGIARTGMDNPGLLGLKVSAQNAHIAVEVSAALRQRFPQAKMVWGGEYPSLMPADCLRHADGVVSGAIEPVADKIIADWHEGKLSGTYKGDSHQALQGIRLPRLDLFAWESASNRFMGLPMESSRGCSYKCTFCMVHTMQPGYHLKPTHNLDDELLHYHGRFLNLIDYNFGLDPAHMIHVAGKVARSGVLGWMAEMCLESLDNDEVLQALAESRCRIIYCGLESVEDRALRSVNKASTNKIHNYERIIRKVQRHGIQIAAGIILGLEGADETQLVQTQAFYIRMGILYTKLTFLTYNPGTKVRESMRRVGGYLSESPAHQDGNHLSYLPQGMDPEAIYGGAAQLVPAYYAGVTILARARSLRMERLARMEYVLFAMCYGAVYHEWLRADIFHDHEAFDTLLRQIRRKPRWLQVAERKLQHVRLLRYARARAGHCENVAATHEASPSSP